MAMPSSSDASGRGTPGAGDSEPRDLPRATPLLGAAWKVLAALAAFLGLVLAGGLVLPGTWSAEREAVIGAPPDSVFTYLDVLERWQRWTPWPGMELTRSGPPRGEGATMTWDDPFAGDGRFTLVESLPPTRLAYRVEVEGGSMVTRGTFRLEPAGGGTRVVWREEGDFGWNPLMGYAALTMDRVQGAELERGLARLKAVAETGELPDSLRPARPGRPTTGAPGGDPGGDPGGESPP